MVVPSQLPDFPSFAQRRSNEGTQCNARNCGASAFLLGQEFCHSRQSKTGGIFVSSNAVLPHKLELAVTYRLSTLFFFFYM